MDHCVDNNIQTNLSHNLNHSHNNNNSQESRKAFKRWKILSEALKPSSSTSSPPSLSVESKLQRNGSSPGSSSPLSPMSCNGFLEGSIRQFNSFGLINLVATDDERWLISQSADFPQFKVLIRRNTTAAILKPIIGLSRSRIAQLASVDDNTGNCGLWPSEELLAYWCLKNPQQFTSPDRKVVTILELGAGMTGLAGLAVAQVLKVQNQDQHSPPLPTTQIIISDGNEQCLRFLLANVKKNYESLAAQARLLKFEDSASYAADLYDSVDLILVADCLFLESSRKSLVATLQKLLRPPSAETSAEAAAYGPGSTQGPGPAGAPGGRAIIMAPSRSGTLDSFIALVEATPDLKVESKSCHWDEQVSSLHCNFTATLSCDIYTENLHLPILLVIARIY